MIFIFCLHRKSALTYFPNKALRIVLPIFRSIPDFVVGIPVLRAKLLLALVIPNALFHENDNPGIPVFDLLLPAIQYSLFK